MRLRWAALIVILALSFYFRLFSVYFPQFKAQAVQTINQNIYNNLQAQAQKDHPAYSSIAINTLTLRAAKDFKRQHGQEYKKAIADEYARLKAPLQHNGQTFLMELDCWHWARYVENTVKHGYPGDRIANGKQWDDLMLAPDGAELPYSRFNFYLSAGLYKVFSSFHRVSVQDFCFYLPLFYASIFLSVLFLFMCRYWGVVAGFITCLFVGFAPIFLTRSYAGWFKTDSFNILFPLLIVWAYLKDWPALAGILVGLFAFSWSGWWFIVPVIVAYQLCRPSWKGLRSLALFVFISYGWVLALAGTEAIQDIGPRFIGVLGFHKEFTIWPNTYNTVMEMARADIKQIISCLGGGVLFCGAVFSLGLWFIDRNLYKGLKRDLAIMLAVWFIGAFFMSFRAMRLIELVVLPLGIALGWFIGQRRIFTALAMSAVILFITVSNANVNAKQFYPMMNNAWYATLQKLEELTPKDAIVNSWWDYGDWFTAISHRRVIFDGQSQTGPRAYWMAKALLSTNEDEAVKILHRLNGDNKAVFVVDYSMVGKISAISYLGNWDFSKLRLYRSRMGEEIKLIPQRQVDDWITKRWQYYKIGEQIRCDIGLENSLFTKLYFNKGEGLKHFKLFLNADTSEGAIRAYQVIW